nr:PREDICTED: protein S100-P [Struthio camelus australis]
MSNLETAMGMTIAVFDKYAKTQGNPQTLTKAELKTLLEKELPNFLSLHENVSENIENRSVTVTQKRHVYAKSQVNPEPPKACKHAGQSKSLQLPVRLSNFFA